MRIHTLGPEYSKASCHICRLHCFRLQGLEAECQEMVEEAWKVGGLTRRCGGETAVANVSVAAAAVPGTAQPAMHAGPQA